MIMNLTTEVSVDEFLSLMTRDAAWQLEIVPDRRRYKLSVWSQHEITPRYFETPDLLDLSETEFRVLTAGLQDITERGEYAKSQPDAAPGAGSEEAPERLHPERWGGIRQDESRDGVL
jgi:hypothetical protein